MADILPFKKPAVTRDRRGHTLCRQGHHKWMIVTAQRFDVKQGKLVTVSECGRCGKRKVQTL
ncbi:hypothetical protein GP2143_14786 [marine gamma proteobacterium HTCC2143]|uniref:Uncharacterized protein n=1 Tax=marine gamma proteobacterium HTCC2143 TaxID=247633 RepID=A0Y8S7_9GAMM|nr:hypothetical protein GP2143_14786 [marine gamma proteobacterium HTCC2143]